MLRNQVVIRAQQAIMEGRGALFNSLPTTIGRILRESIWKTVTDRDGQHFQSFKAFCEYPIYWGLETPFDRMVEFCRGNEVTLRLLVESDSPAAQKAKEVTERAQNGKSLGEAGLNASQVAAELDVHRATVYRDRRKDCANAQSVRQPQQVRAKVNGVSRRSQVKIDKIRKVDPDLADRCERREVKVDAAYRQTFGAPDPVEKLKALITKLSAEQRAALTTWLVGQSGWAVGAFAPTPSHTPCAFE